MSFIQEDIIFENDFYNKSNFQRALYNTSKKGKLPSIPSRNFWTTIWRWAKRPPFL